MCARWCLRLLRKQGRQRLPRLRVLVGGGGRREEHDPVTASGVRAVGGLHETWLD